MGEIKERLSKGEQLDIEKTIYKMMLDGLSSKKIIIILMEEYDFKTEANCYRVINKVMKSFQTAQKAEVEELRAKYIEQYQDLYSKAIANGDNRTANTILDSLTKLQGLHITKVEAKIIDEFKVIF